MLRALTHKVSPKIAECELTFVQRSKIDYDLAACQHDDYEAALTRLGVAVKSLSENATFPDSCFVEDTAIVVDELAVICSMGVSSRRGETLESWNLLATRLHRCSLKEACTSSLPAPQ